MRFPCAILVAVFALALASPVIADSNGHDPNATVSGIVVDGSGGVIPGAAVTLDVAGQPARRILTDTSGTFVFVDVPPGPASVSVTIDGFSAATVRVARRPSPAIRVVLQPLPVSEQVTVRADASSIARTATSTKTDTPLRDVPQSITIITREAISAQGMQGLADVVRFVPGVAMAQGEGNRDAVIVRGNNSTGDFFVDGVRDDVQYFRDLYNVERVEVLKGANAMVFGRGGAGGVLNRVTRQAQWSQVREATFQAGSFANRRATIDIDQPMSRTVAARLTGLYENSGSYRQYVGVERYGFNPTVAVALGGATVLTAGYERFHDDRTADRGIPSFHGLPVSTAPSTFFGDPDASRSTVTVDAVTVAIDRRLGERARLRNVTRYATYDKLYQNVYPAGVRAGGTSVSLSAYNNATTRHNAFNQTDLTVSMTTSAIRHTVLLGGEVGRQASANFRNTGYFGSTAAVTTLDVPLGAPTVSVPVTFRQSATDADNHGVATAAAVYVQDQVELLRSGQAIAGVRIDRFTVDFHNNRTAADLRSADNLVSPRLGFVYKPVVPLSIYGSYSVAFVPRAGDQLSSLSLTNQALDPEQFRNYEVGAKWDARPGLSVTAAAYRLDRTNVAVPDPENPARLQLVDGQRTRGVELELTGNVTGAWSVVAGYAHQRGEITRSLSPTALAGASLAQVPAHSLSIWNRYDFTRAIGAGLGVLYRTAMFTSTDNTVVLPASTRVDAALFVTLSRRLRAQVNVENLFDARYYWAANGNNNITPGAPRALRVSLTTSF